MSETTSFEQFEQEVKSKGGLVYADKHGAIENAVADLGGEAVRLLEKFEEAAVVEFVKAAGYEVMTEVEFDDKTEDARQEGMEEAVPVCSWDMEKSVWVGKKILQGGGNMHKQIALDAFEEIVKKKGWQFLADLLEPHTVMHVNHASADV